MFFDRFTALCNTKGISKSKAVESIGLNRTATVKWKKGAVPSGATLSKLAEFFGVSTEYLHDKTDDPTLTFATETQKAPALNKRDERDIKKKMEEMLDLFNSDDALMFDGEPLDDETRQLFTCAHELGHAVMHPKANTPFLREHTLFSVNKLEIEANRFAVCLCYPTAYISREFAGCSLCQIAVALQLPTDLIDYTMR